MSLETLRRMTLAGVATAFLVAGCVPDGPTADHEPDRPSPVEVDIGGRDLSTGALPFALSPDGRSMAFSRAEGMTRGIFLQRLDEVESRPVSGTEDGQAPFFSPDGQWLGFFARNELLKVPVGGGEAVVLSSLAQTPGGASWSEEGRIVYSGVYAPGVGLMAIPAEGGEAVQLTVPRTSDGELYHHWPQVLPGAKQVLFTVQSRDRTEVAIASLESGDWEVLPEIHGRARYSRSGHLLFERSGSLLAVEFDLDRLQTRGEPQVVIEGLATPFAGTGAGFQVEGAGVLAYFPDFQAPHSLVWMDRQGTRTPLPIDQGAFHWLQVAPDGQSLVYSDFVGFLSVVYDFDEGERARLLNGIYPVWESTGASLVYSKRLSRIPQIHRRSADGSGDPEPLLASDLHHIVTSLSPDDRYVAFYERHPVTGRDIWVLDLEGDGSAEKIIVDPSDDRSAVFSPDGKWLAYTSDRSGRDEVYLRRFEPRSEVDLPVSKSGGREPVWHPMGRELFFRAGRSLLAAEVHLEDEPWIAEPEVLFEGVWAVDPGGLNPMYDVMPDGDRFVMIEASEQLGRVRLITDWAAEE